MAACHTRAEAPWRGLPPRDDFASQSRLGCLIAAHRPHHVPLRPRDAGRLSRHSEEQTRFRKVTRLPRPHGWAGPDRDSSPAAGEHARPSGSPLCLPHGGAGQGLWEVHGTPGGQPCGLSAPPRIKSQLRSSVSTRGDEKAKWALEVWGSGRGSAVTSCCAQSPARGVDGPPQSPVLAHF